MSFEEVAGNETAVRILKNSIVSAKLGLSYLFFGPDGVGKSFAARQFAKSINCLNSTDGCCDQCPSCRKSDSLTHPDLHWLDLEEGASYIKIEQARSLQNDMALRPYEGRAKVFILNNAHKLSLEAANCLLKVLEEPAFDSVIILIAPSLRLMLPTIISRCQKIKFNALNRENLKSILEQRYKLDELESHFLAYYLDGRLTRAVSLSKESFLSRKNIIIDKFILKGVHADSEEIFADRRLCNIALSVLMSWFRDVMYFKACRQDSGLINLDRLSDIRQYSSVYSYAELFVILRSIAKGFEYLEKNVNIRLLMDDIRERLK